MEGDVYRVKWRSGEVHGEGFVFTTNEATAVTDYDYVHKAFQRPEPYEVTLVVLDDGT